MKTIKASVSVTYAIDPIYSKKEHHMVWAWQALQKQIFKNTTAKGLRHEIIWPSMVRYNAGKGHDIVTCSVIVYE